MGLVSPFPANGDGRADTRWGCRSGIILREGQKCKPSTTPEGFDRETATILQWAPNKKVGRRSSDYPIAKVSRPSGEGFETLTQQEALSRQLMMSYVCAQDGRDPLFPPLCMLFARGRVREGATFSTARGFGQEPATTLQWPPNKKVRRHSPNKKVGRRSPNYSIAKVS